MRRKPTPRPPRPPVSLAVAVAALAALASAGPAAAEGHGQTVPLRSIPPRHAASCASGQGPAAFASPCAGRPGPHVAPLPGPLPRPRTEVQLAAAPGPVTHPAARLPAQGAALAGFGLVLLGLARHVRKSR